MENSFSGQIDAFMEIQERDVPFDGVFHISGLNEMTKHCAIFVQRQSGQLKESKC